ncbi:MAG: hypothetical protein IPP64_16645 [Bacteroidetes bacterium]|nr:hypothetical protein [Bacteroidota bacterium]
MNNLPIAVLTGPATASSGEIVTIAFREKENSKSFGQKTFGLSTANGTYTLSDGSALILTDAIDADRKKNIFGKEITPDFIVEPNLNRIILHDDNVIATAISWINKYKIVEQ